MILQFFTRRKIQKLFKVTSKYFCIFSNTRPASWVAHITKDFLTCYSCLYYCSLSKCICFDIIKIFQVRLCPGFIPHCDVIPHCDIFIVLLISLKSCRSNLLYAHPKNILLFKFAGNSEHRPDNAEIKQNKTGSRNKIIYPRYYLKPMMWKLYLIWFMKKSSFLNS